MLMLSSICLSEFKLCVLATFVMRSEMLSIIR